MDGVDDSIAAAYRSYLEELVEARLLIPLGVPGVYGRGGILEGVIEHFERYVTRMGAERRPEVMRFPPLLARRHYLATDHVQNFPNLMGSVHTFTGDERAHRRMLEEKDRGEDWTEALVPTEVMLLPRCLLPALSDRRRHVAEKWTPRRSVFLCLPPRAIARPRPHADVPPARVRSPRNGGAGARAPRLLAQTRRRDVACGGAGRRGRSSPTIRSSAAAAA